MDLFENMDKIKENMLQSLDKITDEKKVIYDQIKTLETEQYILKNNFEYFETYLNFLEYKQASCNPISNTENNFLINPSDLKFEEFLHMNNNKNSNNTSLRNKNDSYCVPDNHNPNNNILELEIKTNNNKNFPKERHYYDNLYDI